jgi:uncharacterized protein
MPITPTYPGVYIDELPSTVKTITGVSTSITAFVGSAQTGPTYEATTIHSFAEYIRIFGGLWKKSNMSYAVYQYFLNGGKDAVIVRVQNNAKKAIFKLGGSEFTLQASYPGSWGNQLKLSINHDVDDGKLTDAGTPDTTLFNLFVKRPFEHEDVLMESFRNVSTISDSSSFVTRVLNEESNLVSVLGTVPPGTLPEGEFKRPVGVDPADDGAPPENKDIMTAINALDKVDLFNILCIPPYDKSPDGEPKTVPQPVYTAASNYCKDRRAILIVDPPTGWKNKDDATKSKFTDILGPDKDAAIFFPHIRIPDPLDENRLRDFVPCGAVAGVIARTDSERGVWKAPAGIEATLVGVSDLTVKLTDPENGELNPLGINCLRILPAAGCVVWGARTMRGADRLADQWKYIPVRRTALYIEESLYRGTQWVVFEPNDEPLWAQIRLNVGAFMHELFRKGAFQGTSPKDAYVVKCDKETTTQYDIDRGIVNILVGFAPLKPAEFVILQIQQLAGNRGGGGE